MDYLSQAAQTKRLKAALAIAGQRYTAQFNPQLNVHLPLARIFDGLSRNQDFLDRSQKLKGELRWACSPLKPITPFKRKYNAVAKLSQEVEMLLTWAEGLGPQPIQFERIENACKKLVNLVDEIDRGLWALDQALEDARVNKGVYYSPKYGGERHHLSTARQAASALRGFARSNEAALANNPFLVLNGRAGSGKTHLLCDIAAERLKKGLPTYLFLGEEFNRPNPWDTIRGKLQTIDSAETILDKLNARAETSGVKTLVMVDAANENVVKTRWEELTKTRSYSHLALAISIRTGYEPNILGDSVFDDAIKVEHDGFAEVGWEAINKFFKRYKLLLPNTPLLNPEFHNPLFLKMFCETSVSLKSRGRKPLRGHFGAAHLFEQYVDEQGRKVVRDLGLPNETSIWKKVIKAFALWMGENGKARILHRNAVKIIHASVPGVNASQLLTFLQRYWILSKTPRHSDSGKFIGYQYRFTYQKFSDHLIAKRLPHCCGRSKPSIQRQLPKQAP